jgi:hypothetical protein
VRPFGPPQRLAMPCRGGVREAGWRRGRAATPQRTRPARRPAALSSRPAIAGNRPQRQNDIKQLVATGLPKVRFSAKICKGLATCLCQSRARNAWHLNFHTGKDRAPLPSRISQLISPSPLVFTVVTAAVTQGRVRPVAVPGRVCPRTRRSRRCPSGTGPPAPTTGSGRSRGNWPRHCSAGFSLGEYGYRYRPGRRGS